MPEKTGREAREILTRGYAQQKAKKPEKSVSHEVLIKGYAKEKKKAGEERARKSMHYSTVEGAFNSASNTIATSYITPYALFLKATNAEIGLLNAAFHLAATVSHIPGAVLTRRMSRKSIWVFSMLISRLAWIPIILLPFLGISSVFVLILFYALFSFFNSLRTPAWTSLIGDIVPDDIRGRYFGRRNMVLGFASLAAMLVSGWLITSAGFNAVFLLSILLGIIAVFFFVRIREAPLKTVYHYRHEFSLSPGGITNSLRLNRNLAVFTIFLSAMSFAVHIAAPFFVVYMLNDLKISYLWYAVIVSFGALAAIVSQQHWGKLSDKFGERKILVITGLMVCLVPFFYLFIKSPFEVLLVEGFSGFVWAGFELAGFNFMLAVTPAEKRPAYVANHSFFKGIAIVLGTFAGGILAQGFQSSSFAWLSGLQIIFLVSFVLRLASLLFLAKVSEAEPREDIVPIRYVFWHAVGVEPAKGLVHNIAYTFHYPYELKKLKDKMLRELEEAERMLRRKTQ